MVMDFMLDLKPKRIKVLFAFHVEAFTCKTIFKRKLIFALCLRIFSLNLLVFASSCTVKKVQLFVHATVIGCASLKCFHIIK
jgi:hypothetical protein